MDSVEHIMQPMNTVPVEFWYSTCIILVAILIWVVRIYFASLQTTINEIKVNIQKLTVLIEKHEYRLEQHDKDLTALKGRKPR